VKEAKKINVFILGHRKAGNVFRSPASRHNHVSLVVLSQQFRNEIIIT